MAISGHETIGFIYARKDFGSFGKVIEEFSRLVINNYTIATNSLKGLERFDADIFVLDVETMTKPEAKLCIEECLNILLPSAPLLVCRPEDDLGDMAEKFHFITLSQKDFKNEVSELFNKAVEVGQVRAEGSV